MTGYAATCVLLLTFAMHILEVVTSAGTRRDTPFEEQGVNFPYQDIKAALNIPGNVYVISRNYGISTKHRCLYWRRAKRLSALRYRLILGATTYSKMFLVKFSAILQTVRTGHHKKHNAVLYKPGRARHQKLRKLMYMNRKKTCMIFVNQRMSAAEKAECLLMRPARYANDPVPEDCQHVYNQNCHGEKIMLYRRWCRLLPERWYSAYRKKRILVPSLKAE